ncbi:MAG TPA: hypothetical protein DCP17_04850 [Ruminococcaceae bacterium]|nr:hypothetical protein [Oscillospiraceae bacterium]
MKIKKISAIILAGALLASAVGMNAFAADANAKPTITVFGNEATPTEAGKEYDFSLRLANFSGNVAGMDIILTSAGAEFTGVANTTLNLVKDSNYTISTDGKTIHIVELTDEITGNETIKLKAKVNNTSTITVTVKGLAKDGETLLTATDYALQGTATVAVAPEQKDVPSAGGTLSATSAEKFIPYGYVKDSKGNYAVKDSNGDFTDAKSGQYREFNKPAAGKVLTFGVSSATKTIENDALQFGSYAIKETDKTFGTMCIAGDWQKYVDYKTNKEGMSVSEIISYLSNKYDTVNANNEYDFVKITFDSQKYKIRIYKVAQTKVMWENGSDLQYALRVYGLNNGEDYAAVGYSKTNSEITFSSEFKADTYTAQ